MTYDGMTLQPTQVLIIFRSTDTQALTLLDAIVVVDDLGHRAQAVGGAGGVGDHRHGRVVLVLIK